MSPADEATFIALWTEGLTAAAIAQRLGIPVGTVKSRAHTLAHAGKLTPRPRGGAYPRQQAQGREPSPPPVQPSDTGAVSSVDTGAVHRLDTGPVQRLDRLEDEVQSLRQLVQALVDRLDHPPVQTPVQITALPPIPPSKATRWNLWLPALFQEEITRLAAERGISPSQLVKEWLWEKLQPHVSVVLQTCCQTF
jgi:hypothetical protein